MAHELTIRENGQVEMAYVGAHPWHKLGQQLPANQPIEIWATAAGMDWKIKRARVQYATSHNTLAPLRPLDDKIVLFRNDTQDALGVVSDRFQVVQPIEVLEFFRDLTEDAGFHLETAGTLFGGKKFWALANTGNTQQVGNGDIIKNYLLLTTGADGQTITRVKPVSERVVCNNTLTIALGEKQALDYTCKHITKFDHAAAKRHLHLMASAVDQFMDNCRKLAATPISYESAEDFVEQLLRDTRMTTQDDISKSFAYNQILDLFDGKAIGFDSLGEGNAWALVNSVSEYIDHLSRATSDAHRMDSALLGKGDQVKSIAMQRLLTV